MNRLNGPTYQAMKNDDQTWYINYYVKDDQGDVRRDTLYDGLSEDQANELSAILNKYESYEYA